MNSGVDTMRGVRGIRRLVFFVGALIALFVVVPSPAHATGITAKLVVTNGPAVPQGLPVNYKLTVASKESSSVTVFVTLSLAKVGATDPPQNVAGLAANLQGGTSQ